MSEFPHLGHGIGLRPPHYAEVANSRSRLVDWFEVITENFMVAGGNPRRVLRKVRERYPIVLHGVSLSLGSVDPLREKHLDDLAALAAETQPAWISDHLCWSSYGGHTGHDLWPLPFTEESLRHVVRRVQAVQERLGRRILIENVSSYLEYTHSTISEWEFLADLARQTDCGLLLDVNNVFVSAHNHGFDPAEFLAGLPRAAVKQIHLAGHRDEGTYLFDTHDHPVCDGVWSLYRSAVERVGPVSTLIERDDDIPPLAQVIAESRRAAAIEAEVLGQALQAKAAMAGDRFHTALADVQSTLYDLITAPEGVAKRLGELGCSAADLESIVRPSAHLSAVERLDVYANMYFYRILDVLQDEYAKVLAVLGIDAFHNVITEYLIACRPSHPSLREVGACLPAFIGRHPLTEGRPWVYELARLERTHLELFDGPDAETLTIDDLRALPPQGLSGLFLWAIPCRAVLRNRFAVSGAWRALGAGEEVESVPESAETVLVWRQGVDVYHRVVDADEEPLLALIDEGARFDAVCERLLELVPEDRAALRVFELVGRWVTDGLVGVPADAQRRSRSL